MATAMLMLKYESIDLHVGVDIKYKRIWRKNYIKRIGREKNIIEKYILQKFTKVYKNANYSL